VSGYQTLSASTDLIPGNIEGGTIFCPSGQQMVGGGWTDNGQFFFGQNLFITQSAPTSDGTSWTAENQNNSSSTVHVTRAAACEGGLARKSTLCQIAPTQTRKRGFSVSRCGFAVILTMAGAQIAAKRASRPSWDEGSGCLRPRAIDRVLPLRPRSANNHTFIDLAQ
jgi:hypothetical protein